MEEKVLQDHAKILRTFDEHEFKFENTEKYIKTMIKASEDGLTEMQDLKIEIVKQNTSFMDNLERINKNLIGDTAELRQKQNELTGFFTNLSVKVNDHKATLTELFKRMDKAEKEIEDLDVARVELQNVKCNYNEYKEHADRVDSILTDFDQRISLTNNHCVAIDNYLDKYQPVRMQAMIGDTLHACLLDEQRRKHELYDQDKIALLYKMILDDTGEGASI